MTVLEERAVASPSSPHRRAATRPAIGVDLLLATTLALLALIVRWPYLWLVPRFTDETLEVLHSLSIVREGARPLTNYDSYYGALSNYLVALAFALGDQSALAPRVVVLIGGVLTVAATYLLGLEVGRRLLPADGTASPTRAARLVGLIAAGLLVVNGPHVVVNSHVAWSNCLTPLFTTLAFWALLRATRGLPVTPRPPDLGGEGHPRSAGGEGWPPDLGGEGHPRSAGGEGWPPDLGGEGRAPAPGSRFLPLAGLLLGLALQTHPLVVALLPGVAVAALARDWRIVRSPWLWGAALAFLVGYANVIAYNAEQGFESLRSAQRIRAEYAADEQAATGYAPASLTMLLLLGRILGGAVDQRDGAPAYLLDPSTVAVAALAALGVGLLAARRSWLPLAVSLGFLLILPAANPKFQTLITSRYLMPLVPLLFASAAFGLVWLALAAGRRRPALQHRALPAGLLVGLVLIGLPLPALDRYYTRTFERTDTNERILRLTAEIVAARRPDEPVLVDEGIGSELPDTGVTEVRGFEYLLIVERVPHRLIRPSPGRLQDSVDGDRTVLAVLNARDASAAGGRLHVEPLDPRPPAETGRMFDFRLYRIGRAGG